MRPLFLLRDLFLIPINRTVDSGEVLFSRRHISYKFDVQGHEVGENTRVKYGIGQPMTKQENIELPMLVVVTGRPASGKTTLAHALAKAIRCPLISRDEIKEGFINTLKSSGQSHSDINGYIYTTFFSTVELLLNKRVTLVAEAAFQHKVWLPKLEALRKVARIRLIHCTIDPQLAKSRFVERSTMDAERVQYHDDLTVEAAREAIERLIETYEPPQMNVPTLVVNTTDGYQPSLTEIVSFIRNPPPDALQ